MDLKEKRVKRKDLCRKILANIPVIISSSVSVSEYLAAVKEINNAANELVGLDAVIVKLN